MKTLVNTVMSIAFMLMVNAQEPLTIQDFQVLNNTQWKGELMYVNYGDDQEVTLQTTMQITIENNKIVMSTQYGNEPEANSKSSIKLKKKGTYLGNEKIIGTTISKNGTNTLITEYKGRDANKSATIYKTYVFDGSSFSVTKEVQFKGTKEKFVRNKYSYTKI